MTRSEELKLFLDVTDELIASKYILADVKIVNVLKSISVSESLIAVFKNCLTDFDYNGAKKRYLVKSEYLAGDKGEFILPSSTKDLLALIFTILVDIDAKRIDFAEFLNKYFYEDGSYTASFSAFINGMIKPFKNSVKLIMESVIEGKLQDPIDAFIKEEARRAQLLAKEKEQAEKEAELLKKENGANIKKIIDILKQDKTVIASSKLQASQIDDANLIIDLFLSALDSLEQEAIKYAYISYKYFALANKKLLKKSLKNITLYIKDTLNAV